MGLYLGLDDTRVTESPRGKSVSQLPAQFDDFAEDLYGQVLDFFVAVKMRFVDGGVVADQHDAGGFALDFLDRCFVAVDEDDGSVAVFGGRLLADDNDVAFICKAKKSPVRARSSSISS